MQLDFFFCNKKAASLAVQQIKLSVKVKVNSLCSAAVAVLGSAILTSLSTPDKLCLCLRNFTKSQSQKWHLLT